MSTKKQVPTEIAFHHIYNLINRVACVVSHPTRNTQRFFLASTFLDSRHLNRMMNAPDLTNRKTFVLKIDVILIIKNNNPNIHRNPQIRLFSCSSQNLSKSSKMTVNAETTMQNISSEELFKDQNSNFIHTLPCTSVYCPSSKD